MIELSFVSARLTVNFKWKIVRTYVPIASIGSHFPTNIINVESLDVYCAIARKNGWTAFFLNKNKWLTTDGPSDGKRLPSPMDTSNTLGVFRTLPASEDSINPSIEGAKIIVVS